jgi:hypothetical protein
MNIEYTSQHHFIVMSLLETKEVRQQNSYAKLLCKKDLFVLLFKSWSYYKTSR